MNEETLFDLLRNTPEAQRPALLELHCADNPARRARVEALLQADEQTLGYLTRQNDPHGTKSQHEPIGATGQIVAGKYKLIDNIGEGGMGSVWRAQQSEPVKRLVAVKLIKAGMDSKAVLARFEAERQALAVMDHPNIAKILDGGLHENRPYFVMELVKGVPITTYCDACKLTPKERLELFLPVCGAIQHAHMKGIIHRDIKPSNVIVALYDDKPIPKVIDFGIAKATGGGLTDASYMTAFGGVVGTPQYMSPEQASLNNLDIDTRSDVYSLGILLYELLAGSPPFARQELENAGLLEILRVVREEEPQRPSAKLSTAAALPTLSANRATDPKQLTGLMRNELDWIVMKSLEKDRTRRYESANSFAADVSRYLAGEAVQAVPPSLGYRMKKWVRKNRGLVIASGLVVGTLSVGVVGTTFGLLRAEAEANRANQEAINANAARATAERNLVQSYMRPVGYNTGTVDPAEYVALAELSGNESDQIKLLFLEEALTDGERALRVARRAERVVQAAVGPSLKRRTAALELCQHKQKDKSADPRIRLCACWLAIEMGEVDVASLGEHFDTLRKEKNFSDWNNFLDQLPNRIKPEQVKELSRCFVTAITNMKDNYALSAAGSGLVTLAPKLDELTTKSLATELIAIFNKPNDGNALSAAGTGLAALAPKLDAATSKTAIDALMATLVKSKDSSSLSGVGEGLASLASQLDNATAKAHSIELIAVLGTSTDYWTLNAAGRGLNAMARQLDAANAKLLAIECLALISKKNDAYVLQYVGQCFTTLATRLDAVNANSLATELLATLRKSKGLYVLQPVGMCVSALPPQFDNAIATALAIELVAVLNKSKDWNDWRASANGLEALANRLDHATAKTSSDALVAVLGKTKDRNALQAAGTAFVALALQLDKAEAKSLATSIVTQLEKTTDYDALQASGKCLAALARDLESSAANALASDLVVVLTKSKNGDVLSAASMGLTALAPKLDTTTAKAYVSKFVTVFGESKENYPLWAAGSGITALAPRLDAASAKRTAEALVELLGKSKDSNGLASVEYALAALAPQLDHSTAKAAANAFIIILSKYKDWSTMRAAGSGLAALTPRLDNLTAKLITTELVAILNKSTDAELLQATESGLEAMALTLDSAELKNQCNELIALFEQSSDALPQVIHWNILIRMAPRLEKSYRPVLCETALHSLIRYERRGEISYSNGDDVYRAIDSDEHYKLLRQVDSIPFLFELLKEPASVASIREAILNRLDELAYPDAAYNAATSTDAPAFASVLGPTAAPIMQEQRHRTRKLRTLHDAAVWLQQHHPEIDLDKPYAKTGK